MHRRLTLCLLLIALLTLPSASAGWFSEPLSITVGEVRAGDRMLYVGDYNYMSTQIEGDRVTEVQTQGMVRRTMLVEGASRATDRFGTERGTVAYVIAEESGEETSQRRCHMLPASRDAVRIDFLTADGFGWAYSSEASGYVAGVSLSSAKMSAELALIAAYDTHPCAPLNAHQGRTLREGDQYSLGDLLGLSVGGEAEVRSRPTIATTFHDRPALRIEFSLADFAAAGGRPEGWEGTASYVFADGLPHAVVASFARPGEWFSYYNMTLAGIERGTGPVVEPPGDASLPERNGDASWISDPLVIDTDGLGFELSFEEAYAAVLAHPQGEFRSWLDAHPNAALVGAGYSGAQRSEGLSTSETGWSMTWQHDASVFGAFATRTASVMSPLGETRMPVPVPPTVVTWTTETDLPAIEAPGETLDAASLTKLAEAAGVEPGTIRALSYYAAPGAAVFFISQVDEKTPEGLVLFVNATAGALDFVGAESREYDRDGLLDLGDPQGEFGGKAATGSAFSALVGPIDGSGLGLPAAAATGLALLIIAAKFLLVPLFTRLRRDRLLDNDVRARLYERVRAEPGLHRAELVDFAGIGEGATRHHLQQLVAHKLLVELDDGGFVRYFAAGEVPPDVARREMALRAGSQRRVYELYATQPMLSLREAGALLGMSAPSVHRAKRKLEKAGLLPAAPAASVASAEA